MKKKLPLVTIITPTYNRADLLMETVDSVLSQDYPNIEYIVIDDGSTDETEERIQKRQRRQKGQRVKKWSKEFYFYSQENAGETRTVNRGLSLAKGEIVAVVSSDDPLLPGAVSAAVDFLEKHPDVLAVYPDWIVIDEQGNKKEIIRVEEYDYLRMLREHFCFPGPGAFVKRQMGQKGFIMKRDEKFRYVADFEFWLRVGLYGKMARIPQVLATFRFHRNSQSQNKNDVMAMEHIRLVDHVYQFENLPEGAASIKHSAYSSAYFHAAQTFRTKRLRYLYYMKSLTADPVMFGRKIKYELVKLRHKVKSKFKAQKSKV